MSKSILVIDTPEDCGKCPCFLEVATDCCGVNGKDIESRSRPDWCPLRDLPSEKVVTGEEFFSEKAFLDGYNACINEILKGGKVE